jgi:hypothetical protein
MTNQGPTPVDHQASIVQDLAGVPVLFRWISNAPARGILEVSGKREVLP